MLHIEKLTKRYGKRTILQDLSLDIGGGTVTAITGSNGCGKSTLLRIIAGLTSCDAGNISWDKEPVIRYIPEHMPEPAITPAAYIERLCAMDDTHALNRREVRERMDWWFARLHMEEHKNKPMKYLSKGTLQKTGIIQALITDMDVLLMDEPLSGQDTVSQEVFVDEIRKQQKQGTTVIFSCHETWLSEALADHIYEIRDHKIGKVEENEISYLGMWI